MAHILIVDDEENVLGVLKNILENKGHTVQTATNGKDGINKNKTNKFDIIITDIFMPDKDGLEFILELTKIKSDVKIIAISGGSPYEYPKDYLNIAEKMGADFTMEKPIDDKRLLEMVDELIL